MRRCNSASFSSFFCFWSLTLLVLGPRVFPSGLGLFFAGAGALALKSIGKLLVNP